MITFRLNGTEQNLDLDPTMPLLWAIRENLGLTGTKFGCGQAQCGACTVHLNGAAIRSCVTPIAAAQGDEVTTIEGLASPEGELHPLQQAWIDEQAPQCGYCQSGHMMSTPDMLTPTPSADGPSPAASGRAACGLFVIAWRLRSRGSGRASACARGAGGHETTLKKLNRTRGIWIPPMSSYFCVSRLRTDYEPGTRTCPSSECTVKS